MDPPHDARRRAPRCPRPPAAVMARLATILTLCACALVAAQEPAPVAKGTGAAKMR